MIKARVDWTDVQELAAYLCGIDTWGEVEPSPESIEEALYDKFTISFEDFHKLVEHLLPTIDMGKTLTGSIVKGFADDGMMLVKMKVEAG